MTTAPHNLLPTSIRLAIATSVVASLAAVWLAAGHASQDAVETAAAAISHAPAVHVTLETVEVVGHREHLAS